jgi:hypothetical protein
MVGAHAGLEAVASSSRGGLILELSADFAGWRRLEPLEDELQMAVLFGVRLRRTRPRFTISSVIGLLNPPVRNSASPADAFLQQGYLLESSLVPLAELAISIQVDGRGGRTARRWVSG